MVAVNHGRSSLDCPCYFGSYFFSLRFGNVKCVRYFMHFFGGRKELDDSHGL